MTSAERRFAAAVTSSAVAVRSEAGAVALAAEAQAATDRALAALIAAYNRELSDRLPQHLAETYGLSYADAAAVVGYAGAANAEAYAAARAAVLIDGLTDTARTAIRTTIADAVRAGAGMDEAAGMVKHLIGLDPARAGALGRYWLSLADTPAKTRARLVASRAEHGLRSRAETIARWEIQEAVNRARLGAWDDARARGVIGGSPTKRWITAEDERVCPTCSGLDQESVPMDDTFSNGRDMPPDHPRCRCTAVLDGL
jgi:SPP1 gp7 family putative phage head morphogenesis protein